MLRTNKFFSIWLASRIRDSNFFKMVLVGFVCIWTILYIIRYGLGEQRESEMAANAQFIRFLKIKSDATMTDSAKKFGIHKGSLANSNQLNLLFSQAKTIPERIKIHQGISVGNLSRDCGLPVACPEHHFALHLYTGFTNTIYPKLCIDGKYVCDKDLNGCGRGINAVVVDNHTQEVIRVSNFDAYLKDLTGFELLLLSLRPGDKIIMFTFDETLSKMSQVVKLLLNELGSFEVQNLHFRTSWFLITEKGIQGYSPFEEIHLSPHGQWALPHDIETCIPPKIEGLQSKPDHSLVQNDKRKKFCITNQFFWPTFCDINAINDLLTPVAQITFWNKTEQTPYSNSLSAVHAVNQVPILFVIGTNLNPYLPLVLETLVRQNSLNSRNVIIAYPAQFYNAVEPLTDLFDVRSIPFHEDSRKLVSSLKFSLRLLFPSAQEYILLSSHFLLSPDFFYFLEQLFPILRDPASNVVAISAWNENSHSNISTGDHLVYRVNTDFYRPKHAFLVRVSALDQFDFLRTFLEDSQLMSLSIPSVAKQLNSPQEILIPDLSRILYFDEPKQTDNVSSNQTLNSNLLTFSNRPISMNPDALIHDVDKLRNQTLYELFIQKSIRRSLKFNDMEQFIMNQDSEINGKNITLFCVRTTCAQFCSFFELIKCQPHFYLKAIGYILRFTYMNSISIYLVGENLSDFIAIE